MSVHQGFIWFYIIYFIFIFFLVALSWISIIITIMIVMIITRIIILITRRRMVKSYCVANFKKIHNAPHFEIPFLHTNNWAIRILLTHHLVLCIPQVINFMCEANGDGITWPVREECHQYTLTVRIARYPSLECIITLVTSCPRHVLAICPKLYLLTKTLTLISLSMQILWVMLYARKSGTIKVIVIKLAPDIKPVL